MHARVDGDTFFPDLVDRDWRLVEKSHREADEKNEYACDYLVYERADALVAKLD